MSKELSKGHQRIIMMMLTYNGQPFPQPKMGNSYPQPHPDYTFGKLSTPPRDLVPIYPAEHLKLPALPTPPRSKPSFDAPYLLTTHLIPSAYLRTRWNAPVPAMPQAKTKEERKRMLKETSDFTRQLFVFRAVRWSS